MRYIAQQFSGRIERLRHPKSRDAIFNYEYLCIDDYLFHVQSTRLESNHESDQRLTQIAPKPD
jgi:hypothetical protein